MQDNFQQSCVSVGHGPNFMALLTNTACKQILFISCVNKLFLIFVLTIKISCCFFCLGFAEFFFSNMTSFEWDIFQQKWVKVELHDDNK